MSAKNRDRHNRFRSITVGFRVSPEEQEQLNRAVALSGLPKQEYCYRKCMDRTITVQPNPRVYKALKDSLAEVSRPRSAVAVALAGKFRQHVLDLASEGMELAPCA